MLSRTADNLYWLSRYVERADSLARIIDVAQRLAALPETYGGPTNEWESAVAAAGCQAAFAGHYSETNERSVTEFLAYSPANPSSIRNCLEIARTNARAVRTALTADMWDAINSAWNDLQSFRPPLERQDLARLLQLAKEASLRFDGSAYRTMLRRDSYWFSRLGVHVERADNTARILDVKYHVLLPERERVGGPLDFFQWASILRSVSAHTSFHWVYRENVQPWLVADFLILNRQMPRSLASCYLAIGRNLDALAGAYRRQGQAQRLARAVIAELTNTRLDDIFQLGLHEFVERFLEHNNRVGAAISEQYLS